MRVEVMTGVQVRQQIMLDSSFFFFFGCLFACNLLLLTSFLGVQAIFDWIYDMHPCMYLRFEEKVKQ